MTEEQRQLYLKALEKRKKKALKSKKASLEFLIEMGILTKKGNLKSPYKAVCIPEEAV